MPHHEIGSIPRSRSADHACSLPPRVPGRIAPPCPSRLAALRSPAEEAAKFKLGIVTYNVPKDWDLPTLLKVCKEVGIAAVECRTTHKHGVEPTLTADQRKDVKKQFADSGVVFWGCGSVCEFHSADPAVVKKNIEECKQFVGPREGPRRQGREGPAQRRAEGRGSSRRRSSRSARRSSSAARPRRTPASKSGSRSTARSRRSRRT